MLKRSESARRYQRVRLNLPVRVSSIDADVDAKTGRPCFRSAREFCTNLSVGGACIRTEDPLAPGHRVLMDFELPHGGNVEVVGRVAWSRTIIYPGGTVESGCGIEFLEESPHRSETLSQLISRRAPESS